MKMRVSIFVFCVFTSAVANLDDPTQIEKYSDKIKTYQLHVPGKEPITIMESAENNDKSRGRWEEILIEKKKRPSNTELKNIKTDIIHDFDGNRPRCYGPSCQEGFDDSVGPQEDLEYFAEHLDKIKDLPELSEDRLIAINDLAEKLKNERLKADRYYSQDSTGSEDDANVYTTWNRLKVKQHKHPYDDKEGWVSMEPIAWSTSKISKWKPNFKKQKPHIWDKDEDKYAEDENYNYNEASTYNYPQKRPVLARPTFINNKLHVSTDFEPELPSKPTWNKPQQNFNSYPVSWSQDDGRRPQKPNCDSGDNYQNDDTVLYGVSDSVVTDIRPANFPYEYEALHQATTHKRPIRRPTPVIYAGSSDYENDRVSRPPRGDGQWVLLSTTKGYKNKKRQRSLNFNHDNQSDTPSVTLHKAVALTVLPVDANMTTSHGGLLEVEKSFQTVEESKQDMDKKNDLETAATHNRPTINRIFKRKIMPSKVPDSSTILAAVGAGMVPATMAMVVPMMLGRRRRRRDVVEDFDSNNIFLRVR